MNKSWQQPPEAIQQEGTENIEVGNLPVYDYRSRKLNWRMRGSGYMGLLISLIQRRKRFRWSFAPMGLAVPIARMLPMPSSWLAMELQPTALIFAAAEVPQAKAIPREMSVMTEVSDLEVVMDAASGWDFVDEDRIVLLGTSQGGNCLCNCGGKAYRQYFRSCADVSGFFSQRRHS